MGYSYTKIFHTEYDKYINSALNKTKNQEDMWDNIFL